VQILINDAIQSIKYTPSMSMELLAQQAARLSGSATSSADRFVIVDVAGRVLEGQLLVKECVLRAGKDDVLRLQCVSSKAEAPPKAAASVIAQLLGFVVPSTPENDAFFESLNSQLDRELIDIDSCSAPLALAHPVAPLPPSIICSVRLHHSVVSSGFAGSTKKTFSWDCCLTCEAALAKAAAHWFPEVPASRFMFKAHGRFE
jgi:hypothetical protein